MCQVRGTAENVLREEAMCAESLEIGEADTSWTREVDSVTVLRLLWSLGSHDCCSVSSLGDSEQEESLVAVFFRVQR